MILPDMAPAAPDHADGVAAGVPHRVALNAVFLSPGIGGMETYVRQLIPELLSQAPSVEFTLFCSPLGLQTLASETWLSNVRVRPLRLFGRPGLRMISELTALGALAARHADLLHSLMLTGPMWPTQPHVVTVPDLTWLKHADPNEARTFALWEWAAPRVAHRASRVIAMSGAAAADIEEHLGVPAGRIDVIPLGAGTPVSKLVTSEADLRRTLVLGTGRVILCIAAQRRHKNLDGLIRALPQLLASAPDVVLALGGQRTPYQADLELLAADLGVIERVRFIPHLSDADLAGLYKLSSCFVFPSFNEGFGLPVLEAMARGLPVVCSDRSSMPEVAGPAALYFDPCEPVSIASAVMSVLGDHGRADALTAAGMRRYAEFTWKRTATGTLRSYAAAWAEWPQRSRSRTLS